MSNKYDAILDKYREDDETTTTLIGLTDFPSSYSGQAGKVATVKITEDGLEFVTNATGTIWGSITGVLSDQTDLQDALDSIVTDHGNLAGLSDDDHTQYVRTSQVASQQTIGLTGSRLTKLWATDLEITNAMIGSITGNSATATILATARTIGGVSFNGSANITVASATGGFAISGGNLTLGGNLDVSGQATNISIIDNNASALDIKEGANSYLKFTTTDSGEKIVAGVDLEIGTLVIDEDAGAVTLVDMSVSASPAAGTEESYAFKIDGNSVLKIYSEADSAGSIQNTSVQLFADLEIGTLEIDEDSGAVTLVDMSVSATPTAGVEESYAFQIDSTTILKIYAEADSSGGIQNESVQLSADLAMGSNDITITGSLANTTNRATKGWFTDLEVTNAIAGDITGNSATVTTITTLAPDTATTQATQGAITSLGTLTGLTMGGNIVMADNSITGIDTLTFTDTAGTIAGIANGNLPDKSSANTWAETNTTTGQRVLIKDGGYTSDIYYAYNASGYGNYLNFNYAKGTLASPTVVGVNNWIGFMYFNGHDGTNFIRAAEIIVSVDGTPGTNDMPGRIGFYTTADGASSSTERMRIDATGLTKFSHDSIQIATSQTPASNGTGIAGEIAWDASYIYVCTATNTWKRASLTGSY